MTEVYAAEFKKLSNVSIRGHDISNAYFGTVLREQAVVAGDGGWKVDDNATKTLGFLNVGSVRFPGGYDATTHYADDGGLKSSGFRLGDAEDFSKLTAVIDYCASEHLKLNFTIDDIYYYSKSYGELRTDVTRLLHYADSHGVQVESIKIGNEFMGRDVDYSTILPNSGSGAWTGYATGAAKLAPWLSQIVDAYSGQNPDIVLETPGWWAGYQGAKPFLDLLTVNGRTSVDAVDLHSNSGNRAGTLGLSWDSFFGDSTHSPQLAELHRMANIWGAISPDIGLRVDGWSFDQASGGASLKNAALAMLQFHNYSLVGVESATAWLAYAGGSQEEKSNHLFPHIDSEPFVLDDAMTAGAAIFQLMQASLVGTHAVAIAGSAEASILADAVPNNDEANDASLFRAFVGTDKLVLYMVNMTDGELPVDLVATVLVRSLENFAGGVSSCTATVLGVLDGSDPSDFTSDVQIDHFSLPDSALSVSAIGAPDMLLDAYETVEIVLTARGVFGTDQRNTMSGGRGNDALHGLAGNDRIFGNAGSDALFGGEGSDALNGGGGNDTLFGGSGADQLNGGAGNDWVSYAYAASGVRASFVSPQSNYGDALGDRYSSVEHIAGSQFDDRLFGNDGNNAICGAEGNDGIRGNGGNDYLYGGSGDDFIFGGSGSDFILGGPGHDTLSGGAGNDRFVFYSLDHGGDTIFDFGRGDRLVFSASGFESQNGGFPREGAVNASGLLSEHLQIKIANGATEVWWDADNEGPADAVEIVSIDGVFGHLSVDDFLFI